MQDKSIRGGAVESSSHPEKGFRRDVFASPKSPGRDQRRKINENTASNSATTPTRDWTLSKLVSDRVRLRNATYVTAPFGP